MSENMCGRQKKAISFIFIRENSLCKSREPSERDRPLDWHFLFVGWVLNREQWWDPSLLLRLYSGAKQGRLL